MIRIVGVRMPVTIRMRPGFEEADDNQFHSADECGADAQRTFRAIHPWFDGEAAEHLQTATPPHSHSPAAAS